MWNYCPEPRLGPRVETDAELRLRISRFVDGVRADMLDSGRMCQMGDFNINITATGGHGCDRRAKPGDKLFSRCGRFNCPDCMAYEFVQQLKQRGMFGFETSRAEFTHWPGKSDTVIDDLLLNERKSGQF